MIVLERRCFRIADGYRLTVTLSCGADIGLSGEAGRDDRIGLVNVEIACLQKFAGQGVYGRPALDDEETSAFLQVAEPDTAPADPADLSMKLGCHRVVPLRFLDPASGHLHGPTWMGALFECSLRKRPGQAADDIKLHRQYELRD